MDRGDLQATVHGAAKSQTQQRLKQQQQNLPEETGFISYSSAHLLKIFIWL